MEDQESAEIYELGEMLTIATCDIYAKVLERFGSKLTSKFMAGASAEDKETFVKRMRESQVEKLNARLTLIMNRILTDHHFIKTFDGIAAGAADCSAGTQDATANEPTTTTITTSGPPKSLEELREENEISNNHLQSVENERSICRRDTERALDRLESLCEPILSIINRPQQ